MKRLYFAVVIIAAILIVLIWKQARPIASNQPVNPASNEADSTLPASSLPNQPEVVDTNRLEANRDKPNVSQSHEQIVQATLEEQNKRPLDLYGVVVDQEGQPVVRAKVEGSILLNISFVSSGGETHFTETDEQGRFKFLGVHGVKIGIRPKKEGYYYDPKLPSARPEDYIPNPNSPLKFVMWKLKGTEPLKHISFESRIPYDGTSVSFDLQTGGKTPDGSGELQVSLSRQPRQIAPGLMRPYNWQVKIAIVNGGIIEEEDLYPYQAKEGGYQTFFETTMSSNSIPWQAEFGRSFYIRNAQGQYGLMQVEISTSSKRPDTGIKVKASINPSGSQNLEPDFLK